MGQRDQGWRSVKPAIFGAAGGNGRYLVEQALVAGHGVTAVARRPPAISRQHKRIKVVRCDVLQPTTIGQATAGSLIAAQPTVYSQGIANIIQAVPAEGVR